MTTFRAMCAALTLAGLAFLAGCATVYESQFQFSQGWRVAEVVRVTQASLIDDPGFWECLRKAPEAVRQNSSFVLVSYRAFIRKRHSLVPLPPNMNLRAGESVYLKLGSCDDAAIARRTARSHAWARQTPVKQSQRQIYSAIPAPSATQPSAPSGARRGGSGSRNADPIEELVRWIS